MKEFEYISWIREQGLSSPGSPGVIGGPGDDCAILDEPPGSGNLLAFTCDARVAGTHFDLRTDPPEDVGYKAMAVNLSDIAAVGFEPVAAVATVCLPLPGAPGAPDTDGLDFLQQSLYRGLRRAAERFRCPVVGGDVVSSELSPLSISVAMLGRLPAAGGEDPGNAKPFLRSGAKPGEAVFVTGELGGSRGGKHLNFVPRLAESRLARKLGAVGAMIDLSDGLSSDLNHICRESGVGAEIEADKIPISEDAASSAEQDGRSALEHALDDGEDFELLFTVPAEAAERLESAWALGTRLTRIGRTTGKNEGVQLKLADGSTRPLEAGGYEHLDKK